MAEKLALEVQGEELVFLANERNIEFIIPQKALKFLCYALKDPATLSWENKKEFYPNGELKLLKFGLDFSNIYYFNRNRELVEYEAELEDYGNVKIANIKYFENNNKKLVKGEIISDDGLCLNDLELLIKDVFDRCDSNSISDTCFSSLYEKQVDINELKAGEFSIKIEKGAPRCITPISHYDKYGILTSCDSEGSDDYMYIKLNENGAFTDVRLLNQDSYDLITFCGEITAREDEKDDYIEITMPEKFCWTCNDNGVLDSFDEDDNGDVYWYGDEEFLEIKEVFLLFQDIYRTNERLVCDYGLEEIELDCDEFRLKNYSVRLHEYADRSTFEQYVEESSFEGYEDFKLIKYVTFRVRKDLAHFAFWGGFNWVDNSYAHYDEYVEQIVMF